MKDDDEIRLIREREIVAPPTEADEAEVLEGLGLKLNEETGVYEDGHK